MQKLHLLLAAASAGALISYFIYIHRKKNHPEDTATYTVSESGFCVIRNACDKNICSGGYDEVIGGLERMLSLPGAPSLRYFQPVSISPIKRPAEHRSGHKLFFSKTLRAVVTSLLNGEAGAILCETLGKEAELLEFTMITSEPGASAQDVHSDGCWNEDAPRIVTMFMAMHDILDEKMGPTRFWPGTHLNWKAATKENVKMSEGKWFALKAGDAIIMDQLTWHCGGENSSNERRTLFSITFMESKDEGNSYNDTLRIKDFISIK